MSPRVESDPRFPVGAVLIGSDDEGDFKGINQGYNVHKQLILVNEEGNRRSFPPDQVELAGGRELWTRPMPTLGASARTSIEVPTLIPTTGPAHLPLDKQNFSPAELGVLLNLSPRDIRKRLRSKFGTLKEGETGWRLSREVTLGLWPHLRE